MPLIYKFLFITVTKPTFLLLIISTYLNTKDIHAAEITSVSLSPHITELIYSAGGGDSLLGVSAYSNHPTKAATKPIIGDAYHLNLELISELNPDLIFYWHNGTPKQTIEQLQSMDAKTIGIEIIKLSDIPQAIHQIANALQTQPVKATDEFLTNLNHINNQPHKSQSALIQISDQPIFTVNGSHWMSEAIGVCGLNNVFNDLAVQSAAVDFESVILKSPEVIIRTSPMNHDHKMRSWKNIPAIKNNQVITLEADHFTRPTLRIMFAIESLCNQLQIKSN